MDTNIEQQIEEKEKIIFFLKKEMVLQLKEQKKLYHQKALSGILDGMKNLHEQNLV